MLDGDVKGKKVLLGITGGIAAYKIPEFARLLVREGALVRVVATDGGLRFISGLVFEAITRAPVYSDAFKFIEGEPPHIFLGNWADAVFVAPASADFIAKAAYGICDNLLLSILLATRSPVGIVPSMNWRMLEHRATVRNIDILRELGYKVLEPEEGSLICGEGKGRLPDLGDMLNFVRGLLGVALD